MSTRTPSYCHHKGSGQAVVRIDGKDHYLGKYGTEESRREYDRLIAEWLAAGQRLPEAKTGHGLSVSELILAYWKWAEKNDRDADGAPTRELPNLKDALRPLRKLYGDTEAARFGPMALRTVREDMIASGLCCRTINTRIGRLKRVFKWSVSYELLPASVYEALRTVPGLQRGRSKARDTEGIKPVSEGDVRAVLPFLPPQVTAAVAVQLLTGCRVTEALTLRGCDLDVIGPVWTYRPAKHKNRNRGIDRVIFLVVTLPSGREMYFRNARVEPRKPSCGGRPKPTLVYDNPEAGGRGQEEEGCEKGQGRPRAGGSDLRRQAGRKPGIGDLPGPAGRRHAGLRAGGPPGGAPHPRRTGLRGARRWD